MSPTPPQHTPFFVELDNVFTPAELDMIEAFGDALALEQAGVNTREAPGDVPNSHIRVTSRAGIACEARTQWLYDRMQAIAQMANEQVYQFDLRGFSEPFQYAVYRGAEGGHYNWHVDHGDTAPRRKLSFTLQLSDPAAYEGGDLQFQVSDAAHAVSRARGTVIAFPAFILHRVTPVLAGTRKSLVAWCAGPKYR